MPPDVRGALRALRRSPGFVTIAAVTLGLGAGTAAATFALVRGVVLEPLPVHDEGAVVVSWGDHLTRGFDHFPYSYDAWQRIADGANGLDGLAATDAWGTSERLIEDGDRLTPTRWARVLGDFFGVLGVPAVLGRPLDADDDVSGGPRVVVVSRGFWIRRWGGDPSVVGSTLRMDGEAYTVVGVLPGGFDYPRGAEVWTPTRTLFEAGTEEPPRLELNLVARLAPGSSADRFGSEITRILRDDAELTETYSDVAPVVRPFRDVMLGDMRPVVLLLFAGALLLLIVAVVNVANLVAMRAGDSSTNGAIRRALGAGRGHLTIVPIVESSAVVGLAAIVAVIVTTAGLHALLPLAPAGVPILDTIHPGPGAWLTLASVLVTCAILFAGIPLWPSREPLDAAGVLRSGMRAGRRRRRGRAIIVAGQAALALWAVVAAALLVRSLANLRALDTGFDDTGLHVVQIDHPHAMFAVPPDWPDRVLAVSQSLEREPAIIGATAVLVPPLVVNGGYDFVPTLDGDVSPDRSLPYLNFETVMPGYFRTLDLPVVRGRSIETADVAGSMPVAIVNETAARALWPGEDAIGKRMVMPWPGYEDMTWTVVGVAADARYRDLLEVRPSVYVPLRQMTLFASRWIAVRTSAPVDLVGAVRRAFADVDPAVRVVGASAVHERMSAPLARPRFALTVLGVIASIILLLAAVGAYGVLAAGVRARSRELGVRMACGATPGSVGRLVLREALLMAGTGAIIGACCALATGRFVDSLLFGVRPNDPIVFGTAAAIVLCTALLACVAPALMAARTDPLTVLRSDG